jgi:hypothetical protein
MHALRIKMSAWSINIVSVYINVQCIIFMFKCIVPTVLTSSISSVSVNNDGFMEYNKWMNEKCHVLYLINCLCSAS